MAQIIRPCFGQPCGRCPRQVPLQRVRLLEAAAEKRGALLRKSDILCVDCQVPRDEEDYRALFAKRRREAKRSAADAAANKIGAAVER